MFDGAGPSGQARPQPPPLRARGPRLPSAPRPTRGLCSQWCTPARYAIACRSIQCCGCTDHFRKCGELDNTALRAAIAAVDWRAVGRDTWQWTRAAGGEIWTFLAGLPLQCKAASLHASLVCLGESPQYYQVPGFGPMISLMGGIMVSRGRPFAF